jgi:hypothetical protein
MQMIFTIFTLSGPFVGLTGYFFGLQPIFWIGFALACANLFMNIVSGAMRFPVLPIVCAAVASVLIGPWYEGVAIDLLAYTLIEGLSELTSTRRIGEG